MVELQFLITGATLDSIFNSPQFFTRISINLLNQCERVGAVTFGEYQSSWGRTFGLAK